MSEIETLKEEIRLLREEISAMRRDNPVTITVIGPSYPHPYPYSYPMQPPQYLPWCYPTTVCGQAIRIGNGGHTF